MTRSLIILLVLAFATAASAVPVPRIIVERYVPDVATFEQQRQTAARLRVCAIGANAYRETVFEDVGSLGTYLHREVTRPFDCSVQGPPNRPMAPAPAHLGDGRVGGP